MKTSKMLEELDVSDGERRILEVVSDGGDWIPDQIATTGNVKDTMLLLGRLELKLLLVRRWGYYVISKKGAVVLEALRRSTGADTSEGSPQG